jgi:hypothetical protein
MLVEFLHKSDDLILWINEKQRNVSDHELGQDLNTPDSTQFQIDDIQNDIDSKVIMDYTVIFKIY